MNSVASNDDSPATAGGYGSVSGRVFLTYTNTGATQVFYIRILEPLGNFNLEADDQFLLNLSLTGAATAPSQPDNADTINGGEGNDHLFGVGGDDVLDGGDGADFLAGGTGDDTYIVNDLSDVIVEDENEGLDTVAASISYALAADLSIEVLKAVPPFTGINLTGNNLPNSILGNGGPNVLNGQGGDDTLDGGGGDDVLNGGSGNDILIGGAGGIDTASYADAAAGVTVRLATSSAQNTIGAGVDTLSGIEWLTGSVFADSLFGDGLSNVLSGGGGDDYLDGGAGFDVLRGDAGDDHLDGGADGDFSMAAPGTIISMAATTAIR